MVHSCLVCADIEDEHFANRAFALKVDSALVVVVVAAAVLAVVVAVALLVAAVAVVVAAVLAAVVPRVPRVVRRSSL